MTNGRRFRTSRTSCCGTLPARHRRDGSTGWTCGSRPSANNKHNPLHPPMQTMQRWEMLTCRVLRVVGALQHLPALLLPPPPQNTMAPVIEHLQNSSCLMQKFIVFSTQFIICLTISPAFGSRCCTAGSSIEVVGGLGICSRILHDPGSVVTVSTSNLSETPLDNPVVMEALRVYTRHDGFPTKTDGVCTKNEDALTTTIAWLHVPQHPMIVDLGH